jgi:hypothetical protein
VEVANNQIKINIMKRIVVSIFSISFLFWGIGCKPDVKDIGEGAIAGDGLYGTWEISQVVQTDLKMPLPETRDISSFFSDPARKMQIRFNKEGSTYQVLQAGWLPKVFGTDGTWAFNQSPYPTAISFYSSQGDTLSTPLSRMPREYDVQMGLDFVRTDSCGNAFVKYEYTFKRLN